MIAPDAHLKIYVATRPVDFRKGHDGLAAAVQEMLGEDPFSGAVFVFRSKQADRIKILVWDQTGMVLIHKRLEGGKFVWPQIQGGVIRLSAAQFAALFEGLDWRLVRPANVYRERRLVRPRSDKHRGKRSLGGDVRHSLPAECDAVARVPHLPWRGRPICG